MAIQYKGKLLTPRQQKAQVMKWAGWSEAEYKAAYEDVRKRTANYQKLNGIKVGTYSPADILARDVRGRWYADRQGELYKPSSLIEGIFLAPTQSGKQKISKETAIRVQVQNLELGLKSLSAARKLKNPIIDAKIERELRAGGNWARRVADWLKEQSDVKEKFKIYRDEQIRQGDWSYIGRYYQYED